jgi:hypothetical protein
MERMGGRYGGGDDPCCKLVGLVEVRLILAARPAGEVVWVLVSVRKLVVAARVIGKAGPDNADNGVEVSLCGQTQRELLKLVVLDSSGCCCCCWWWRRRRRRRNTQRCWP